MASILGYLLNRLFQSQVSALWNLFLFHTQMQIRFDFDASSVLQQYFAKD